MSGRVAVAGLLRRWVSYLVVGATSTAVDLGLLVLLHEGAGAALWVAATFGYWSSVIVNFTLNRHVSFGDRPGGRTAVVRFGVLLGVNWTLTLLAVSAAVHLGWPYAVGKVGVVGLLTVLNYTAYSRWVFAVRQVGTGAAAAAQVAQLTAEGPR